MSEKNLTSSSVATNPSPSASILRMAFIGDEKSTVFGRRKDFVGWSQIQLTSQVTTTVGNIIALSEEVGYINGTDEWTGDDIFVTLDECDSCDHTFQSGEKVYTKAFGKIREHICCNCADKRDLK